MENHWVTIWAQAHTDLHMLRSYLRLKTMRTTLLCCVPGDGLRLRFSNRDGRSYFVLSDATVCFGGKTHTLTFGGSKELTLAPGKDAYCDEILFPIAAGESLTVTAYYSRTAASGNQVMEATIYSQKGNFVHADDFPLGKAIVPRFRVAGIPPIAGLAAAEVWTKEAPAIIACFGDSITQQSHWVNPLNQTFFLRGNAARALNLGIGGNRVLSGDASGAGIFGRAALERFRADVLAQPGVTAVIFALGTNDIGKIETEADFRKNSAENIFAGLKTLADAATAQGLRVYFATVTPRMGSAFYGQRQESIRMALNSLIREHAAEYAGLLDFDAAIQDVLLPDRMQPGCDSGDHLHPGPIGGLRMAQEALRVLDDTRL